MGVNTERKDLNLRKCSINQNISCWVEQDIIVPDTKPDAIKIINVMVSPYVTGMEVMDGKVKVVGKLNYFIIYRVNDETFQNRGLFMSYPYTEILEVAGITKDMDVSIMPVIKNVIYSLPNERKMAIKSEIIFKVKVIKPLCVNLIHHFESDNLIECKMCKGEFNNIIQCKKDVITSREDVMLPKEAEDFFELLKVDTKIINTEYKESYNKIMVKGDIEVKMIYLSENPEDSVKKLSTTVPFSSMVELDNINDNSKFNIQYVIQDFNVRLNEDITTTKTLVTDFQIEVNVEMFEEEEIEYVEDFYSQTKNLIYDHNPVEVVKKDLNMTKRIDVKENLSNILQPNMKLLDYELDVSNVNATVNKNSVILEGNARILLLLQNTESLELESKIIEIMINQNFELDTIDEQTKIYVDILVSEISVNQSGLDLEVKITLVVESHIENVSFINLIDNILEEELDLSNLDSINIYIVKPKDTLWNIAKKYKTSVEKIVKTNNIENPDLIDVGQKILIIR